jgi:hypothetical protein
MNISKVAFEPFRKSTVMCMLNGVRTKVFLEFDNFRGNILTRIANRKTQLALTFDGTIPFSSLQCLSNCYNVKLEKASLQDISPLKNVQNLQMTSCHNISTITIPVGLETLTVYDCNGLSTFERLDQIYQVQTCSCPNLKFDNLDSAVKLKLLVIVEDRLTTLSVLPPNMQELIVCSSKLRTLPLLIPATLQKIALKTALIANVASLGNVQQITIRSESQAINIDCLDKVPKLKIFRCTTLSFDSFLFLKELEIEEYQFVELVVSKSKLPSLEILSLVLY